LLKSNKHRYVRSIRLEYKTRRLEYKALCISLCVATRYAMRYTLCVMRYAKVCASALRAIAHKMT